MNLFQAKPGDMIELLGFEKGGNRAYRQRLMAMGLMPGITFKVSRLAPLGDPVEIKLPNLSSLILRKAEAACLRLAEVAQ